MSRFVPVLALLVASGALALAWQATRELQEVREELAIQQGLVATGDGLTSALRPATSDSLRGTSTPRHAGPPVDEPTSAPTLRGVALVPGVPSGEVPPGTEAELGKLVDRAVDERVDGALDEAVQKGVRNVLALQDKRPAYTTFSEVLDLEATQSESVTRDITQAQSEILQVLRTPADDGTVFFDRLVDLMAEAARKPGQDVGWKAFLERVLSEPLPGANTTYGARIEGIKGDLQGALRRTMDDRQWASFEAWQMDPTQIRDIPGSPYAEVGRLVAERAQALADDGSR
ncbi:MAG: hypothetical protein AB7T63_06120 [Planctomycetota bacterium]